MPPPSSSQQHTRAALPTLPGKVEERASPSCVCLQVRAKLPNFKPQGLVNTAWAFSTFGRTPAGLFEAILAEAETRLGEFNTLAISSLVWSATNIGVVSRTFFDAVAEQLAVRAP
eukprot:1515284-Pleurochrysis_carterae.AAC.1